MKRIVVMMLIALICFPAFADNTKLRVAVFGPGFLIQEVCMNW